MINSAALFPSLSRSSGLSPRSSIGLNIIRRDSIAVDRLLKERLVLSKVRYGIERQEQERERRRNREADLEADSKQNYEVGDAPNDPRKRRRGIGGLLGSVFGGILSSLGGVAFQAAPAFLLARRKIIGGGSNFNRTIGATGGLLNTIKGQKGPFDTLRKVKLNPVRNIGKTITRFGNSLTLFVNSAIAGQIGGRAIDRFRTPAQVKAQVAQSAKVRQRATSGVRAKSRAGVRAGQIDIEEALELRRSQENARARQRVNVMRRQQEIQAEAAAETAVKKRRRKTKSSFKQLDFPDFRTIKKTRVPVRELQLSAINEIMREQYGDEFGRSATATLNKPARDFNIRNKEITFSGDDIKRYFGETPADIGVGRYNYKAGGFSFEEIGFNKYNAKKTLRLKNALSKKYGDAFDFEKVFSVDEIESNVSARIRQEIELDEFINPLGGKGSFNLKEYINQQMRRDNLQKRQLERMQRSKISGTGKRGTDVTSSGQVGSRVFTKPDGTVIYRSGGLTSEDLFTNAGQRSTQNMFRDMPTQIRNVDLLDAAGKRSTRNMFRDIDKVKPKNVIPKKGIGKFLSNIGGAQFLKPVKEFVGQGIKNIPFIGDLIGILLDVFVFGEPIQRALFLAGGSALGGFLGGLAGAIGGPPGILIGGIIGGIAGDLLGGAFYDLLFRRGQKGSAGQRFGASATKASIKAGLYTGGFAGYGTYMLGEGGREFVLDADSTAALERRSPGFLMALNKARGAEAIGVIEDYASYDKVSTGKEKMVPIPIPIPQKGSSVQEIIMTDSEAGGGTGGGFITFLSEHYRRG